MISTVYKRMFSVLKKRFFSLLGVLLLAIILWFVSSIAVSFIPLAQLSAAAQSWARASRTSSTGVPLLMYLLMTVVYALWFCGLRHRFGRLGLRGHVVLDRLGRCCVGPLGRNGPFGLRRTRGRHRRRRLRSACRTALLDLVIIPPP